MAQASDEIVQKILETIEQGRASYLDVAKSIEPVPNFNLIIGGLDRQRLIRVELVGPMSITAEGSAELARLRVKAAR